MRGDALEALDRMEEAVASDREAVAALSGPFLALPQAFAGLMLTCVQLYLRRAEAAGIAPNDDLLAPLVPALEPFIQQPGSDEG